MFVSPTILAPTLQNDSLHTVDAKCTQSENIKNKPRACITQNAIWFVVIYSFYVLALIPFMLYTK